MQGGFPFSLSIFLAVLQGEGRNMHPLHILLGWFNSSEPGRSYVYEGRVRIGE